MNVVIVEGWMLGFTALTEQQCQERGLTGSDLHVYYDYIISIIYNHVLC